MAVKIVKAISGKHIRLTDERWQHIIERHPELGQSKVKVLRTINKPDVITLGWEKELIALRKFRIRILR